MKCPFLWALLVPLSKFFVILRSYWIDRQGYYQLFTRRQPAGGVPFNKASTKLFEYSANSSNGLLSAKNFA